MDPLTIAITAATVAQHCIRVSSYLYSFINSGNNIDATVTVLRNEVDSLRQILAAIADSCRQPEIARASQNEQETVHWRNLKQALDDCEGALGLLEGRLEGIQSIKAKAGLRFVKFISKKVKWESTSQDLFRIRQQISSCREAMGLSLQWITLSSILTNRNLIKTVPERLDMLAIELHHELRLLQSRTMAAVLSKDTVGTLPLLEHLEAYISSTSSLVSSASPGSVVSSVLSSSSFETVVEDPMGGTPVPTEQKNTVRGDQEESFSNLLVPAIPYAHRVSMFGEPLSSEKQQMIEQWNLQAVTPPPSTPSGGSSSSNGDSRSVSSLPKPPFRGRPPANRLPRLREIRITPSDPQSFEYRQLERLREMNPDDAAEKLGREYFSDLDVLQGGERELYTKDERWEEIRYNIRMCHSLEGSGYGYTLCHAFASNGRLNGVRRLLELGYDVDATDRELWTASHYAAASFSRTCYLDIIRSLVEAGADIHKLHKRYGYTLLHYTAKRGDIPSARFLLNEGANVNHEGNYPPAHYTTSRTPITDATQAGHIGMVRFLLDNRANVRWKDVCGGTYLHMAARYGHDDIARLLLDRGVDRWARETGGKTAADLARRWEEDYGKGKRLVNI